MRKSAFSHSDVSQANINVELLDTLDRFEENTARCLMLLQDRANMLADRDGQEIAKFETLRFFRKLPSEYFDKCDIPEYFRRVIGYIEIHEKEHDFDNNETLERLALCHLVIGDQLRAFHYLSQVTNSQTVAPETAFLFAFTCFSLYRYETAIRFIDLAESSDDPLIKFDSILIRAIILLSEQSYQPARDQFIRLLDLEHPLFTRDDILFQIVTIDFHLGNVSSFHDYMLSLPSSIALQQRAYMEALAENWDNAKSIITGIPPAEASFDVYLLSSYVTIRQKRFLEAYTILYNIYHKQDEKNAAVWCLIALAVYNAKRNLDYISLLDHANKLEGENPWIERCYGAILELSHRYDEADRLYQNMVKGGRLQGYANYRSNQINNLRQRIGTYDPPDTDDIPVTAFCKAPSDQMLEKFRTEMLLCSKNMMSFLGDDIEPVITEVHRQMTLNLTLESELGVCKLQRE